MTNWTFSAHENWWKTSAHENSYFDDKKLLYNFEIRNGNFQPVF